MRALVLPLLLLAACSPEPAAQPPAATKVYAGSGRDRLCLKGDQAGFIAFGTGDSNCTARGRVDRQGDKAALVPAGDPDCRIGLNFAGDRVTLGATAAACAYYCGPGADFAGKSFSADGKASPAVDFAGDPLC